MIDMALNVRKKNEAPDTMLENPDLMTSCRREGLQKHLIMKTF